MAFSKSLWDGTDPLYAPCISWTKGTYSNWKCPASHVKAGYAVKSVRLEPGHPNDEHALSRAMKCRELTKELVRWAEGQKKPRIDTTTWRYLLARYTDDEFSPMQATKANSRESNLWLIGKLEIIIGHMRFADLNYEQIMRITKAMEQEGRSVDYIRRMMTCLRAVAKYGRLIGIKGVAEVKEVLGDMRFKSAPKRQVAPTRDQVEAIVAAADNKGEFAFATGLLLQYEFMLRAVDVRGQWFKTNEREGGIIRNGRRWQDGLTWDMFDADLAGFSKVISKTAASQPDPYHFNLADIPYLRQRIADLAPPSKRLGPVITTRGMPFTASGWSHAYARHRATAGVPNDVWCMDMRAGGVTEGDLMGASRESLSQAAQHSQLQTTGRYARGRSENAAKVVKLRQSGRE